MKKLLLLPVLALSVALISFSPATKQVQTQKDTHRSQNDSVHQSYSITKNTADPSLSSGESEFVFTFKNYAVPASSTKITFSCNEVNHTESTDKNGVISLKVKPGKCRFQFYESSDYYEIYTDSIAIKPGYRTEVQVNFEIAIQIIEEDKPVIYVYPAKTEAVSIQLELRGKLGFTFPEYKNGWNFKADPDGTIHMGDKKYNYLFWEGNTEIDNSKINWEEGFAVDRDSLVPFFEKNLSAMGMNSKEIEDYITYWCPLMKVNERNYVHFIFNEDYDQYALMHITPKPDHVFRVFMLWSKIDGITEVKQQSISSFQRGGFTVVEWGGSEMNEYPGINIRSVQN